MTVRNKVYTNDLYLFNYNSNYNRLQDIEIYINNAYKIISLLDQYKKYYDLQKEDQNLDRVLDLVKKYIDVIKVL